MTDQDKSQKIALASVTIEVKTDHDPDLSFLGDLSRDYVPGALPYPGPGREQNSRHHGGMRWLKSQHWPHNPSSWSHVDAATMAKVKAEHGGPIMADYHYAKRDRSRLVALAQGEWWMVGVYALAKVTLPKGDMLQLHSFRSGGLWGIESDSGEDCFQEVAAWELADLHDTLTAFGVDLSDWAELSSGALEAFSEIF